MMQQWSSSEIPLRDRLSFWVDVVCRTLADLRCEPRRDQPFFGEISHDEFGPLKLVTVRSVGQRVSRSTGLAANDPAGFYHVNTMGSGRGLLKQDGRETELASGGFAFGDSCRPYAIDFIGNYSSNVLRIPRPMLQQHIDAPECFTGTRVDGASGLGAMVSSMLGDLPGLLSNIPKAVHKRAADNIVDLVAAALLTATEDAPLSAPLTLTRAKFWIEAHLTEKLSGEEIAHHCNVSVRHLNRLFESEDTSLMRYVWKRRLVRSRRDLSDPALRHRSIGEIAQANGFNNLSHFSREFHACFGIPARAARRGVHLNRG